MATISDTQILTLRSEAASAGDIELVTICELAIDGPSALDDAEPGTEAALLAATGMTQEQARARCAEVIDDAAAQDDTLRADEGSDGWSVVDSNGGRWWPDTEASEEIDQSADPARAVLTLCRQQPMRGAWNS